MWLIQKFLAWFTGKDDKQQAKELKEAFPEAPPRLQIRTIEDARAAVEIKTFRDVKAFCEEVRKTLRIYKKSCEKMLDAAQVHQKAIDHLYVEMGNVADKIVRLIDSKKGET